MPLLFLPPKQANSQPMNKLFIHNPNFQAQKSHNALGLQILVIYKTNNAPRRMKRYKSTNAHVKAMFAQGLTCFFKALTSQLKQMLSLFWKDGKNLLIYKNLVSLNCTNTDCRDPDNSNLQIFNVPSESHTVSNLIKKISLHTKFSKYHHLFHCSPPFFYHSPPFFFNSVSYDHL